MRLLWWALLELRKLLILERCWKFIWWLGGNILMRTSPQYFSLILLSLSKTRLQGFWDFRLALFLLLTMVFLLLLDHFQKDFGKMSWTIFARGSLTRVIDGSLLLGVLLSSSLWFNLSLYIGCLCKLLHLASFKNLMLSFANSYGPVIWSQGNGFWSSGSQIRDQSRIEVLAYT